MNQEEIRGCVARILASRPFAQSERMRRFLTFTVEEALAGRGAGLKEALVGMGVFDRASGYDPRIDPIVRVEARRLRAKLGEYYAADGQFDAVRIEYPRGSYVPVFHGANVRAPANRPPAIAVLPFENLSPEPGDEYFSAGLAQELIHSLTRLAGLRVMAWNSVQRLHEGGSRTPAVEAVLEGSVRRSGSRLKIAAQLVDTASGLYIWAGTYERQLLDLLAVQEELAQAIAGALQVQISGEGGRLDRPHSVTGDAYALYLRGRHAYVIRSEEALRRAVVFFDLAIQNDPGFALAHAGLADAYWLLSDYGYDPPETALGKAKASAERALELDPALAEAHTSIAAISTFRDWDWERGERHYRRAIELNPGFWTAHHWYGIDWLALQNRMREASAELSIARELNPLDPMTFASDAYHAYLRRDFAESERLHLAMQREYPEFLKGYTGLARVYDAQGRYAEAWDLIEQSRRLAANEVSLLGAAGQIAAKCGRRDEALRILEVLERQDRYVPRIRLALVHVGLGNKDAALGYLEEACTLRESQVTTLAVHPAYDDLRGEARFRSLLGRVGVPDLTT